MSDLLKREKERQPVRWNSSESLKRRTLKRVMATRAGFVSRAHQLLLTCDRMRMGRWMRTRMKHKASLVGQFFAYRCTKVKAGNWAVQAGEHHTAASSGEPFSFLKAGL